MIFQAVPGGIEQIFNRRREVNCLQSASCNPRDLAPPSAFSGEINSFRLAVGEGLNHA
jgi:hypothetical protein